MWPDPVRLVLLGTGAAMVLLAGILLALDFNKRANRAFAALLALKGGALLVQQIPALDAGLTGFTFAVFPYLIIPLVPVAIYFASVYPRPRGPLGRSGGGWLLLGVVVVLEALYFLDHDLYQTVERGNPAHPALEAFPGYAYTAFGPLSLLSFASFPALGLLALLFMRDYTRTTSGPQRFSQFLVGAGFTLNALFDGVRQVSGLVIILTEPGFPLAPWGWGAAFLPTLSLVPAVVALAVIARHRFHTEQERRLEHRFYAFCVLAVLTGLAPFLLPAESGFFDGTTLLVLLSVWRLALPVLVTYSLLRYALFDIDVHVRHTIRHGTVAAVFGAVYFLISEGVEALVSDAQGSLFGLGAAALLTVAIKPLRSFGARVAGHAMPDAVPAREVRDDHAALYREHFEMVYEDGQVTPKERRLLDTLAWTWSLPQEVVQRVEAEVAAREHRTWGGADGPGDAAGRVA